MITIIRGWNRAEFNFVANKNKEKQFYMTGNQQYYRIYPQGFMRMRVYRNGEVAPSEEVIIYRENEIIPYHTRGLNYDKEEFVGSIFEHKGLTGGGGLFDAPWMVNAGKKIWQFMVGGGGIALIVLIYALLAGGK